jgi:hypothetical protein
MKQVNSIAVQRSQSGRDTIGHSSVQPWSAGPLFPAVIARIERYGAPSKDAQWAMRAAIGYADEERLMAALPLAERLECTSWELNLDGVAEEYASYEDAEHAARLLLAHPEYRVSRRDDDGTLVIGSAGACTLA